MKERYQKFLTSRQEPLRLSIALADFDRASGEMQADYKKYLHRRLQPAAAALIEADDTERLEKLTEQGWFTARLTDDLIRLAREKKKTAALVWLLRWKGEQYGFRDRDFSL